MENMTNREANKRIRERINSRYDQPFAALTTGTPLPIPQLLVLACTHIYRCRIGLIELLKNSLTFILPLPGSAAFFGVFFVSACSSSSSRK